MKHHMQRVFRVRTLYVTQHVCDVLARTEDEALEKAQNKVKTFPGIIEINEAEIISGGAQDNKKHLCADQKGPPTAKKATPG